MTKSKKKQSLRPATISRASIPSSQACPKDWPGGITYLRRPVYSKALGPQESEALHPSKTLTIAPQESKDALGPSPLVQIRPITSPASHPALGQYGLFAAQQLPAGTFIIQYLGFVHTSSDADAESNYDLSLVRELGIGIDATHMGNEARFINDYRGIREEGPNAEFRDTMVGSERRMSVYVLPMGKSGKGKKGISKGEEICVSYGKGFWKGRVAEAEQNNRSDSPKGGDATTDCVVE